MTKKKPAQKWARWKLPEEPKVRFSFLMDPGQMVRLRGIEAETGARISEQLRRAIDLYLAEKAKSA